MIYEYECVDCGHAQEEIHGMNENPEFKCERCRCDMKRIISGGSGVVFKGSDWPTQDAKFKKSMEDKSVRQGKKATDHVKPVSSLGDL